MVRELVGLDPVVNAIAIDTRRGIAATGGRDKTVKFWDLESGRLLRMLEGHTAEVTTLSYSKQADLLASADASGTLRLWSCDNYTLLGVIGDLGVGTSRQPIAFHPELPLLALSVDGHEFDEPKNGVVRLIELNLATLATPGRAEKVCHYVNAKVVLLGDTGVGKSGLSLVLNGLDFAATDSTPGRKIWALANEEVTQKDARETRETLLWDLAGQPGYRIIHQLHLNEVVVALIVFDARSETDPLTGVRHWDRALRLARQRHASTHIPVKKFLVSARADRGGVSVSRDRIQGILAEFDFDGYFETSAKEGWAIRELRRAIDDVIVWALLPRVTSSELFVEIKSYLLAVKHSGRLLASEDELFAEFERSRVSVNTDLSPVRDQFVTCIGRLENRGVIRQLSFGGYILLQPELLDAYSSAIVNAAKEEPDGFGSIAHESIMTRRFHVPEEQRIRDPAHEQLLLHATVEELVRYDLALREDSHEGRYLVFPSQFNRDFEDGPQPKGTSLWITFDGPVQSLYATLIVRLGHSAVFTTGRADMWRNAAIFKAPAGGRCGVYLQEFAEARGRLAVFYSSTAGRAPSNETRFNFEQYVITHVQRRAVEGTVEMVRLFICSNCGDPVPDSYVKRLLEKGLTKFTCPCGTAVPLVSPTEMLGFPSAVSVMDQSADSRRDLDLFIESASGETGTPSFAAWVGDRRAALAIVFTDIVDSTALGQEMGDVEMGEVRRMHFTQSRRLIAEHRGREIKTIGDSVMAAFRSAESALEFALAVHSNPGHARVKIRAGVHVGSMQVEENDVFGSVVNFAARVVGAIDSADIALSERAKEDVDAWGVKHLKSLKWTRRDHVTMKGFQGVFRLWVVR